MNDFCIFRDREGIWHAIGIMGTGTWDSERSLFHSSSPDLDRPFRNHEPLLVESPPAGLAPQKHAPFVVERNGVYHLYYRRPLGTILRACTEDPWRWPGLGEVVFQERDARDVCILEADGRFLMYYCQSTEVEGQLRACVMLRTSDDLMQWSDAVVVHDDGPATHSFLESPYVIRRPEGFYLFICHRRIGCRITVVLFSEDPRRFGSGRGGWLTILAPAHAAEIVEWDGKTYLAAVSGPVSPGFPNDGGWVDLAELGWQ